MTHNTLRAATSEFPVLIIGAGFSGLGMAILLKQAGLHSFTVLEKASELGGTWRENTYPGAACDVPSHLYSYSFEPNPAWSRRFSPQREILEYLRHCARKYGLGPHLRFNATVEAARFDEATGTWSVQLRGGERLRARALVLGNGALHLPALPDLPGRESFQGKAFHSACWEHGHDVRGRRVAVVGTGASAIQIVPELASQVERLYVFQRTAPWVIPRRDRALGPRTRALFQRLSWLRRLYRASIYWRLEATVLNFLGPRLVSRLAEWVARRHLRAAVKDERLRAALSPSYRLGCKRVLLSDDYYPAFNRPNVELVTEPIDCMTPRGVRTRDGVEREVDTLVYGTGFRVAEYLTPIRITGVGGVDLEAAWREAPEAYLGITVSGFPNLYLLMGPNTGLGHNSIIFMLEAQARYALRCIQALRQQGLRSMDVRPEAQASFNGEVRQKLRQTVWASGCHSWYLTPSGRNPTLWPGSTWGYWLRTRRVRLEDYVLR